MKVGAEALVNHWSPVIAGWLLTNKPASVAPTNASKTRTWSRKWSKELGVPMTWNASTLGPVSEKEPAATSLLRYLLLRLPVPVSTCLLTQTEAECRRQFARRCA